MTRAAMICAMKGATVFYTKSVCIHLRLGNLDDGTITYSIFAFNIIPDKNNLLFLFEIVFGVEHPTLSCCLSDVRTLIAMSF